jgi:hypothetical protein
VKQFVIKRENGQYYKGTPQSFNEGSTLLWVDDRHDAKRFSEADKEKAYLLLRDEEWEELKQ